jgi:hypothetical protein
MVTVGVDLHKRMSQIAVLSDQGKVTQRRLANDATRIGRFFHELPPARVAIEASGTAARGPSRSRTLATTPGVDS